MGKFVQALAYLLPQGAAWPRDPNSVLMRLLGGMAEAFNDLHLFTGRAVAEWMPHTTNTRLEEWEDATGLPDPCYGPEQAYEPRRLRLLTRLRGASGYYPDSSPASPGSMEAIALNAGFVAVARYNTPFRCGRDRVGRCLGTLDGKLYLLVAVVDAPFRVAVNRVGDRLVTRPPELFELICAFDRYVPARFELNVIIV